MNVFVKQLQRWVEVTDENREVLTKFGAIKPQQNDVKNSQRSSEPISRNTKRTSKPRKSA
jgi:hypothetical protein